MSTFSICPSYILLDHSSLLHKLIEKDFTQRIGCLEVMQHSWFISSFPEDQGLGRIMERMRTGDRPLTMLPSMAALYDDLDDEYELDDEGNAVFLPLKLTDGGEENWKVTMEK